ncbi:MAG: hypothetical protein J6X08_02300 [Lachnospiraceae bacterium]|nr:hypothetical protein [Lachnospiraceae bacterium]
MNVKEQLKTDIERYKGLKTRGEKAAFVWDYYKYPLIALGTALVILALVIINNLDRVKTSMFMVMVNSDAAYVECDDSLIQAILTRSDYETGGKKIEINASYTIGSQGSVTSDLETIQVLTALFSISDLDVYIADREYFDYFATSGGYADLSLLIDKELLKKWEDNLYYYENEDGTQSLIGIVLPSDSIFHDAGYYHDEAIMGVVGRADNLEAAVAFVTEFLKDVN